MFQCWGLGGLVLGVGGFGVEALGLGVGCWGVGGWGLGSVASVLLTGTSCLCLLFFSCTVLHRQGTTVP